MSHVETGLSYRSVEDGTFSMRNPKRVPTTMDLGLLTVLFVLSSIEGFILDQSTPETAGQGNVDGSWTKWSSWSRCDVIHGTGKRTRSRKCTNPAPANLGLDCTGRSSESETCYLDPVYGGWSAWSSWGTCSVSCDVGNQRRDRTCTNPSPQSSGNHCYGDSNDNRLCFPGPCADGGWSSWTRWGSCSKSCGVGIMTRERFCNNPVPSMLGSPCTGPASQSDTCGSGTTSACTVFPNVSFIVKSPQPALKASRPIFQTVIQNEGDSYNASTGVFTCRVSGLYHFAFNFMSTSNDRNPLCYVYHNYNPLIYAWAKGHFDSGTMVVYLNLSIGETIDIVCVYWEYTYHDEYSSWFTGSLIRR